MTTMDSIGPYGQILPGFDAKRMRERPFPMRGRVAWGAIFALLLIVGIGGWSVTAKLSGAVIGTGTVLVDEDLKVVQHIEGGVVRDIAVRKGDTVAEGQLLLRLDDVQVRSELAIVLGQLAELTARRARLLAERDGAETLVFPAEYFADYADAELIADGERQLFDGNMHNHVSQKEQLALQVAQLHEEVNGLAFQKTAIMAELDVTLVDRERMLALAEERLVETSRISEIQRDVARLQGQQGEIEAAIARALSRTSEVELQILALDGALRTEAQRELRTVEAQIAELEERLGATEDRLARSRILAPVSGTVNELNVTTLGGVISPGEALVTIVPQDAELIIEFQVAVNDIDQIAVGRQAKLRFSAFNQRTTPELAGTIIQVSAAAQYNSQTGASYYLAQVEVNEAMEQLGGRELVPGMPVEIFVETEEQLAIAYFVKPFTDQIARAFREE